MKYSSAPLALVSAALSLSQVLCQTTTSFTSIGNPILADGSVYSADAAPIVVNGTVYIIAGRDEAGPTVNDFVMPQWQIFETQTATPAGGDWILHQDIAEPQTLFAWAAAGTAYASQIVQGVDGRYYLYAPVTLENTTNADPFAIGVAVSDSPLGPYTDAHPSGPIISQSVPAPGDNIQNIDPTVMVDTDGRVFIYWGTFNALRGAELEQDMVTIKGSVISVTSLTGFFEASWLMKRNDVYYLLYAGNNAGADSPCTPTSYHACIAYGTASNPLGPWTYRGIVLGIISSTTSHPGVFQLNDDWYMTYHTRDAVNGTHFRRSIAFDKIDWDDTASPPSLKVTQTFRPGPPRTPTRNIAPSASPSYAGTTPIQYWIASINDGRIEANPLPPDYWSSYAADQSPASAVLSYTWNHTVELNGTAMAFFADHAAGANVGVAPPASWSVEYLDSASGVWTAVEVTSGDGYPTAASDTPPEIGFSTVSTTALRATLNASGSGGQYAGLAVKEWIANAPTAQ